MTPEQIEEARKLKALFKEKSPFTQKDFATRYGLRSAGNIWHYLNGTRPLNLQAATAFASGLGIGIAEFSPRLAKEASKVSSAFSGQTEVTVAPPASRSIPVLSYRQVAELLTGGLDHLEKMEISQFIQGSDSLPKVVFSLVLEEKAMSPVFMPGDTLVIDPTLKPVPGDIVIGATMTRNGEVAVLVRRYRDRGMDESGTPLFELVPSNEDFPTISSANIAMKVLGVVIEHRRKLR